MICILEVLQCLQKHKCQSSCSYILPRFKTIEQIINDAGCIKKREKDKKETKRCFAGYYPDLQTWCTVSLKVECCLPFSSTLLQGELFWEVSRFKDRKESLSSGTLVCNSDYLCISLLSCYDMKIEPNLLNFLIWNPEEVVICTS